MASSPVSYRGDALVRVLAEAGTLEEAGRAALELLATGLGWRAGVLWIVDPDETLLRCAVTWGGTEVADVLEASRRLALRSGDGIPGRVWAEGEPLWVEDILSEPAYIRSRTAERVGLRTIAVAPVCVSGRTIGVLELLGDGPRPLDATQLELLETVGRQLGQFILRIHAERRLAVVERVHSSVVDAALDCIITMDHRGQVLDFNPAAERTFGFSREDAVGRPLADLIIPPEMRDAHWKSLRRYVETREASILNRRLELSAVRADGTELPVELTVTRLGDEEPPVFAGFLRDITERRRAEEELTRLFESERTARLRAEAAERTTRRIADVLQRSLLPPHLPDVPGVRLGAAYRAGSDEAIVGGDFYDVFDLGDGRWGFVVGDVCGKGPEAASVTALTRYAVRAAAVRERRPSAVLRTLNETLLHYAEHDTFCTAIYAVLTLGGDKPTFELSTGGHPSPLLRGADGSVSVAPIRGTLLGALEDPVLDDLVLELEPGTLVTLYTDGLVESRGADGDIVGLAPVAETLSAWTPGDAQDAVDHVVRTILHQASRADDDVALLALLLPVRDAGDGVARPGPVNLEMAATPAAVPEVRHAVCALAAEVLAKEGVERVAQAVTEAAANVVVHAYRNGLATGDLRVRAEAKDAQFVVEIEDDGVGVTPRSDSPGLGVGLRLIEHFATAVEVRRSPRGGGLVRMRFGA